MYCPRIWPRANFLKKVKDQKVEANSSSSSASKIILIVVIISVLYIYLTIFSFFETIIIIEYDFLRLFLLVCASLISHAVADNIISNIMQILFVSKQQLLCLYGSQAWINIIICFFFTCAGDLAKAIRNRTDIRFGLYHSLFEFYNDLYLEDKANNFTTQKFVEVKFVKSIINSFCTS